MAASATVSSDDGVTDKNYLMLKDIEIRFVSLDKDIKNMIEKVFSGYDNLSGEKKVIQSCESADCIVSPANSFGQMDGGIDGALSLMLSTEDDVDYIGKKVRQVISDIYFGEQPVGTCILLPTDNEKFPFLAHAPTMATPSNVSGTFNPYYAFRAVLLEVIKYNRSCDDVDKRIKSVLTTTFATGCGGIGLEEALEQMKLAYDKIDANIKPSWSSAGMLRQDKMKISDKWHRSGGADDEDFEGVSDDGFDTINDEEVARALQEVENDMSMVTEDTLRNIEKVPYRLDKKI